MSLAASATTFPPQNAEMRALFDRQRQAFNRQGAPSYEQRLAALDRVMTWVEQG